MKDPYKITYLDQLGEESSELDRIGLQFEIYNLPPMILGKLLNLASISLCIKVR